MMVGHSGLASMLYSLDLVTSTKLYPRTALALLTALNLFNYIDRSVLFAVQDLVKAEFHNSDTAFGVLTSVFFIFYMCAAPFMGPLAERFSRKSVIITGAFIWSGATLLTAFTHDFTGLIMRHTLVGIGEASFVILSPTFVADMFPESQRGRVMGVFYLAIPVGTALGYVLGKTVHYVNKAGKTVKHALIKPGAKVQVVYEKSGDTMVVNRVVVEED